MSFFVVLPTVPVILIVWLKRRKYNTGKEETADAGCLQVQEDADEDRVIRSQPK